MRTGGGRAGKDNGELVLKGSRASVLQDGEVLEKGGGDGCTAIRTFFFFFLIITGGYTH